MLFSRVQFSYIEVFRKQIGVWNITNQNQKHIELWQTSFAPAEIIGYCSISPFKLIVVVHVQTKKGVLNSISFHIYHEKVVFLIIMYRCQMSTLHLTVVFSFFPSVSVARRYHEFVTKLIVAGTLNPSIFPCTFNLAWIRLWCINIGYTKSCSFLPKSNQV